MPTLHFKTNVNFQRQNFLWTKDYDEGWNNKRNQWNDVWIIKETYFALFPSPKCLLKQSCNISQTCFNQKVKNIVILAKI